MIKNYLKIAWRNLVKDKHFFAINFIGLYISVVVSVLIILIILHELSFDSQNTEGGLSVFRVVNHSTNATGKETQPVTPYPLATAMRVAMPDEKYISQIHRHEEGILAIGDKKFHETNILFADSVFPKIFKLSVKKGSIEKALAQPNYAILTEKTAEKLFGSPNEAIGKRLKLDNLLDLEISAIVENSPSNTHLPFNILVSYPSFSPDFTGGIPIVQWGANIAGFVYIGLSDKNQMAQIERNLVSIVDRNVNTQRGANTHCEYKLQPLADIHFNKDYAEGNPSYTIDYQYLYFLGAIGLFLILAACINYTNLSTALAFKKSKEVGIRKTMGANRLQLIAQFMSETFLLTGMVIGVAAISAWVLLPSVNTFLDKNIPLSILNLPTVLLLLVMWIGISVLSGVYPSLILSGFNPINALKSKINASKSSTVFLRRGLVVFQFLTTQVLFIAAIVVAKQLHFINSKPLGFNKEQVVDINLPENKTSQLSSFRSQIMNIAGVEGMSYAIGAPISENQFGTSFNLKERYATEHLDVDMKLIDNAYLNIYGLQLVAGRWFDDLEERISYDTLPFRERKFSLVVNETTVKKLGFKKPEEVLGKELTLGLNDLSAPVVGVIKDYHTQSLHANVQPVVMMPFPFFYYNAGIKLSANNSAQTLAAIEKAWSNVYPNHIFESNFLDEHVLSLYKTEQRNLQLFNIFTFLSILINALGLIGLLSFVIQQKTKEIGIRKVLGASVAHISFMLTKDFLILIGIAFLIAAPVSWYLMNQWLQDFAYRTQIEWWVFAVAVLAALLIALLTVSFQAIKAAVANPVKSLRTE
jgi:ABC-type antimicrobial peptide transport system permease subunit